MVLIPATTDKFTKVGAPGTATTMSAPGFTSGVSTTMPVGSTTNWPTDTKVVYAVDRAQVVNGVEERIAGSYNEFEGIVTGANTISSVVRRLGTPQNYPAGSLTRVYIPVAATRENDMVEGLNQDHNGKGNHKSLTDDNNNEWIERGQVSSAVNQVKVTNAVTGTPAKIEASGDDSNVDLSIDAKGTGVVKIQGSVPQKFFAMFNFIESGCVWSGDAYGSTRNASMTTGFVWIAGKRLLVAAIVARAFTASKDTYVDFQDNGDGTALVVYTEATNNAASPVIPNSKTDATNVRNTIIITGASSIANVGSVNQGEENKILPIASNNPYAVTDSLGNLISPRDPNRKILGYRQLTSNFTVSSGSATLISNANGTLSVPVIVPAGRKIRVYVRGNYQSYATATGSSYVSIYDTAVGGTQLNQTTAASPTASSGSPCFVEHIFTPSSSNKTFVGSLNGDSTAVSTIAANSAAPLHIVVELA